MCFNSGNSSCLWIILIILIICCCCGNSNGSCGCNDNCNNCC